MPEPSLRPPEPVPEPEPAPDVAPEAAPARVDAPTWAAAAVLALALAVALATGHVPPWRGVAPFLIGLALLAPWPGAPARAALAALALAPVLLPSAVPDWPGEGTVATWALVWVAAAVGGWWRDPWRLGVAGAALVVGLVSAIPSWSVVPGFAELGPILGLLPAGAMVAAVALAVPARRASGGLLVAVGVGCLAQGAIMERAAGTLPLAGAAWTVERYQAGRLWPVVELRAAGLVAADRKHVAPALEVVGAAPYRARVGAALTRAVGAEIPLRIGWDPRLPLDPAVAFDVAVAAHELGLAEIATRALAQADVPADLPSAPGVVLARDVVSADVLVATFRAEAVNTVVIEAIGVPRDGSDALLTVSVGGRTWGPEVVPAAGAAWAWETGLGPGIYRLRARLVNPDAGRRLEGLRIEVR